MPPATKAAGPSNDQVPLERPNPQQLGKPQEPAAETAGGDGTSSVASRITAQAVPWRIETPSWWYFGKEGDQPLDGLQTTLVFLICLVPNLAVLAFFSDVGLGSEIYNLVAPRGASLLGDLACTLGALSVVTLYVIDWFYWTSRVCQVLTAIFPTVMITLGAILKGRNYPWAPILFVLFLAPVGLGTLRVTMCRLTRRRTFYSTLSVCFVVCSVIVSAIFLWWMVPDNRWNRQTKDRLAADFDNVYAHVAPEFPLNYTQYCHPILKDTSSLSKEDRTRVKAGCQKAAGIWFLVYLAPAVCILCDLLAAAFSAMQGCMLRAADTSVVVRSVKHFIICLVFIIGGMYCSASFFSVAMTTTFVAFFAAALTVLIIWTVLELGTKEINGLVAQSKLAGLMVQALKNDWMRAMGIGAMNVFIPTYFFLNYLNQKVRIMRGEVKKSEDGKLPRFTPHAQMFLDQMKTWDWCSILTKVAILSELFFTLQVGFTKATYVFLSWLTRQLATINFGVVCCLVFAVGWTMFLLPPVPGVPVYIFSGIVLADVAGRKLGDNGFYIGILVACLIGFVCKLVACCCQYLIGFALGQKVKVQQLIKVDSVPTRAVEKILNRPGLDIGKVAILIGGPDWPVSVTCGILKLNVPQMILGTCPVLFILSPCVLAGAFISRQGSGGEDSIWPTLANFASVFAFAAQLIAMLTAGVLIVREIEEHSELLKQPRKEHEAVEELTRKEAEANRAYCDVTKWEALGFCDKLLLETMLVAHLLSGGIFVLMGSLCFLPFSVDKDINAPIDEGGLGGNGLNIVLPLGWLACSIFSYGVFAHILHCKIMARRAKGKLPGFKYHQDQEEGQATAQVSEHE